jgi:hypothetical protein
MPALPLRVQPKGVMATISEALMPPAAYIILSSAPPIEYPAPKAQISP